MKTIVLLILATTIITAEPPEIEDFVLKGYEKSNFKNVLLDPDSPISDFYLITDVGTVLKVNDMGLNPEVQKVFTYDGKISEALSNDDTHYLSLIGKSETMLIATKDFLNIDTLYSETNAEITDFQIDDNKIYLLSNNGVTGKIIYAAIGENNWKEKAIPDIAFNRIFVMDSLIVLYKYLGDDITLYFINNFSDNWRTKKIFEEFYKGFADLKEIKNTVALIGDSKYESNRVYFLNNFLDYYNVDVSAIYDNILNDIGFEAGFDFRSHTLQIGNYLVNCDCGYLFRFTYNGDVEQNMYYFPNSHSLNKIKSNKRSKNIQFVAVGDDGLILLINRSKTAVEEKPKLILDNSTFTYYPNPIKNQKELIIKSKELINNITISDITGRQAIHYMQINQYEYSLPINGLATGVYFLTVNGKTQKLMVE